MTDTVSRRQVLFLALFAGSALADEPLPKLNEKDSVAVALGYVSDAKRVDKNAAQRISPEPRARTAPGIRVSRGILRVAPVRSSLGRTWTPTAGAACGIRNSSHRHRGGVNRRLPSADRRTPGSSSASRSHNSQVTCRCR